jgi:uncharacterized Zn-binding protein involved in type VI secretion
MPPAARVGDQTAHGSPLAPGPGSTNVIIGKKPAWRALSDTHACPLVDGLKPHVGGIAPIGSKTVLINGLPAARAGDMVTEAGPPNTIVLGEPTVIIGDTSVGGASPATTKDIKEEYMLEIIDEDYNPIGDNDLKINTGSKKTSKGGIVTISKEESRNLNIKS